MALRAPAVATSYPLYHLHYDDTNASNSATNGLYDWRLFFQNYDEVHCAVTECQIREEGCLVVKSEKATRLSIIGTYPDFKLHAGNDVQEGYQEKACLVCKNHL